MKSKRKRRVTLTPALERRILKDVHEGIPPQVAAVKAGVPLEKFLDWLSRKGRRYVLFQQAIQQAQAVATAENILLLKKAAKKGKFRAAVTWLQSQAPTHFPIASARGGGVNIGTLNATGGMTLIQQLKALPSDEQIQALSPSAKAKARELARKDPSLIGQVMLVKLLEGPPDPRLALAEAQVNGLDAPDALPPAPEPAPENVTYESNVIADGSNLVEMIRSLPQ